jgi:membrane fusion protein, multidrug efflux system
MDIGTRDPVAFDTGGTTTKTRPRNGLALLLSLVLLAAIGAAIFLWPQKQPPAKPATAGTGPVPVLVAAAKTEDVPVMLPALGTVQAFNTVTIKPMVDGPLIAVDFNEGQMIRKGQVLARIDPRIYQAALDSAVAKKAQDEATLANAKVDLARYQKLVENKYASAQQLDTQKALVAQLQAQTQQDQAAIETARTNLSYTTITSPIDGRTGMRQLDAGNIVHATDVTGIVVITQLQPISVIFTLPQQDLQPVAAAMAAGSAPVIAYPQGADEDPANILDRGTLAVLDNQVDPTTGTIKLKATFPNQANKLWPGGFVGVRLQVATDRDATVVPLAAVQQGPNDNYVYIANSNNTVTRRTVSIGYETSRVAAVAGGVSPGERVVTDGASRLTDGKAITIAPAAGAPAPTPADDEIRAPGAARIHQYRAAG